MRFGVAKFSHVMIIAPLKIFLNSLVTSRFGSVRTMYNSKGPGSSVPVCYIAKFLETTSKLSFERNSFGGEMLFSGSTENVVKEKAARRSMSSFAKKKQVLKVKHKFPFERHKTPLSECVSTTLDEADSHLMHVDEAKDHSVQENRDTSDFSCGPVQQIELISLEELTVVSKWDHHCAKEIEGNNVQIGMEQSMINHFPHLKGPQVEDTSYISDSQYEYLGNEKSRREILAKPRLVAKFMHQEAFEAKNSAIKMLSRGPLTTAELRKKLNGKSFPSHSIENAISDLQRCGLQSDTQYAEGFASSKWQRLSWGPMRIKQALKQRGVEEKIVEKAVSQVFLDIDCRNEDEEEFEIVRWGMARSSVEHLLSQARKQWFRGGDIPEETRKRRLIGWLQRRGFTWKVITEVLKSLENSGISWTNDNSLCFDSDDKAL
ncbi:hypothetical protein O6H91_02G128000 [Diphasiastrum complanatum]|uniref:Uncharacterized protein n=2 Tax=Diphasiastrum complanatum TaxID=34168 RepID=A0ACC2EKP7_DIPCM|nr:hypothetical protein O6H91_02G128000 [Diphasiastrum complanatum]KAJ7567004.1 hypothetical protein O6H91_02G128000 [Diphasiastrum complanatum]